MCCGFMHHCVENVLLVAPVASIYGNLGYVFDYSTLLYDNKSTKLVNNSANCESIVRQSRSPLLFHCPSVIVVKVIL